jgi:hypothetical protein
VGPKTGPDAVVKRKIPSPCRESNPDLPARIIAPLLTELRRFAVKRIKKWDLGFLKLMLVEKSQCSSFNCGLEDRGLIPDTGGDGIFSLHRRVQIRCGVHTDSYPVDTGAGA